SLLNRTDFNNEQIRAALGEILKVGETPHVNGFHDFGKKEGWDRIALETREGHLIPILHLRPESNKDGYVIMAHTQGKQAISPDIWKSAAEEGKGIVLMDLSGTGELT